MIIYDENKTVLCLVLCLLGGDLFDKLTAEIDRALSG
jgi:hypothetical protein